MTEYDNVIKKDVVTKTVQMVEQRIKEYHIEHLEEKIKDGVFVGNYEIYRQGEGYSVREDGVVLCKDLYSLDVTLSIVRIKLKNRSVNIDAYVAADHNYSKYKNDSAVYQHIMETSKDITAIMVAEDRLNISKHKMLDTAAILSKLKTDANASVFDK
jgi:hypothetical protein